jgi:hypothetical protein
MESLASGLAAAVRSYVAEQLDAHAAVNGELQRQIVAAEERIASLEAGLAEVEMKALLLGRVA